jgi:hypothetical protein
MIIILFYRQRYNKIVAIDKPNQNIKNLAKISLIVTIISFLVYMLFFPLRQMAVVQTVELLSWLISGLNIALIFGIIFGGLTCIQHSVLHLILWGSGAIPWNYARFLSYAHEKQLIRQIGGRYRFTHDLLREHFAHIPILPQEFLSEIAQRYKLCDREEKELFLEMFGTDKSGEEVAQAISIPNLGINYVIKQISKKFRIQGKYSMNNYDSFKCDIFFSFLNKEYQRSKFSGYSSSGIPLDDAS